MFETTTDQTTRFAKLREAARAKVAANTQPQPTTLDEAFNDDATLTAPMSVEDFIAKMGLEGNQ